MGKSCSKNRSELSPWLKKSIFQLRILKSVKTKKLASEACEASRGGAFPPLPSLMKNISNSESEVMFSRYDESASKQAIRGLAVQRHPVHNEKLRAQPVSKLSISGASKQYVVLQCRGIPYITKSYGRSLWASSPFLASEAGRERTHEGACLSLSPFLSRTAHARLATSPNGALARRLYSRRKLE